MVENEREHEVALTMTFSFIIVAWFQGYAY